MRTAVRRSLSLVVPTYVLLTLAPLPSLRAQANFFQDGDLYNVASVAAFSTTGASMIGMRVSWDFADLTSDSGVWGDVGGGSCGVSVGGFQVLVGCDENTFGGSWTLLNATQKSVAAVQFNGAPGRTLFDCGFSLGGCVPNAEGDLEGTTGSQLGASFVKTGGTSAQLGYARYSNRVGIGGAAPVGDLYEQMFLRFDVLRAGETYIFRADTDNSAFDAPPPTVVPEPSTYVLLGSGLLVIGVCARRKNGRQRADA